MNIYFSSLSSVHNTDAVAWFQALIRSWGVGPLVEDEEHTVVRHQRINLENNVGERAKLCLGSHKKGKQMSYWYILDLDKWIMFLCYTKVLFTNF